MTTRLTRPARATAVAALALTGLLALSACAGGGSGDAASGGAGSSSSSGEIAADAAYNAQDVTFVQEMKPHHQQAVEMADMILAKNPGPQVKALADKIKAAQEPEITQLDAMLAEFGVEDAGSGMSAMPGMSAAPGMSAMPGMSAAPGMSGMEGMSMQGMMSAEDMQALQDATGAQAEKLFLEGMLVHHKGAVEMATKEIDGGKYPQAVELAKSIKADQQAEITEIQQLLGRA